MSSSIWTEIIIAQEPRKLPIDNAGILRDYCIEAFRLTVSVSLLSFQKPISICEFAMPTMLDVAKRAGVALSTVSYAISGTRPVAAETRRRIHRAMDELDYHPNLLARSLITKRTRIIALLLPSIIHGVLNDTQSEFVTGAARLTSERKYGLLLWTSPVEELNIQRLVQEGLIEGLVLMEVRLHDERVEMLRKSGYPFALIGHCADNEGISFVDLDFVAALRLAVDCLADLGHQSIAFLNYRQTLIDAGFGPAMRARDGFVAAVAARGVRGVMLSSVQAAQGGTEMVQRLLVEEPHLTGLIVADEGILAAVTQTAYRLSLRIPDDLSVISIMDCDSAERMTPPMTHIDMPAADMGRIGVELLIEQLENRSQPVRQILLSPRLRIAQSTAGPRY